MSSYQTGCRVFGCDPGLASCGWGIVGRVSDTGRFYRVDGGVIQTGSGLARPLRLHRIHAAVADILKVQTGIKAVAIEEVYFGRNVSSALSTGAVIGVVSLAAAQAGLPVVMKSPTEIKKDLTGGGRSGKDQVSLLVHNVLGLPIGDVKSSHETDALAVAVAGLLERGR